MKKVIEEKFILSSKHQKLLKQINFGDIFSTTNHVDSIKLIAKSIFDHTPKWVDLLFTLRNKMVGLIGLKNEIPKDYTNDFKVGGYVGLFKIYNLEDSECILGLDDSHLNFRVIINKGIDNYYNINVITLVEYNNLKGKIYMSIIKPFHRIVVKRMVANACNHEL